MEVAESWHVWDFVEEEMHERGWTKEEVAKRMTGDFGTNYLMLELLAHARDEKMLNVVVRGATADLLAEAFGTSADLFANLDESWKAWMVQHPEAFCDDCRGPNIVWFAPNELWNRVMGSEGGIVCPICFAKRAEAAGFNGSAWELRQESREGSADD